MEWLLSTYTPDMMWVSDDVFTINHKWIRDYAAEMRARGLRIPFECISRADRLNAEMLDLLAELGCFRIWIGSESGSQRILDAMDRGVKVEQVHQAVEMSRERGIQSGMFLMWGYEGEELEDIEATIQHVSTSQPDIFLTTVSYPIKGTPYYKKIADRLVQLSRGEPALTARSKIKGRHSQQFYKYADKLLKDEVQLARLAGTPRGQPRSRIQPPQSIQLVARGLALFPWRWRHDASSWFRIRRSWPSTASPSYDDLFTRSAIGRAQREVVWKILFRHFDPGDHILELNCGTGEDAVFLARHDMRSSDMTDRKDDRDGAAARAGGIHGRRDPVQAAPTEYLAELHPGNSSTAPYPIFPV